MNDDYLWDGSGKPDPEVERLENLLGRFRHNRSRPEFPETAPLPTKPERPLRRSWLFWRLPRLAGATAVIALVVTGAWYALQWSRALWPSRPGWQVVRVEGTPKVGSRQIAEAGRLDLGEWLETDGASRARINVGVIGEVEVEPNTRIQLVDARPTQHRLALARGTMHATIWAPPRLFFVNTPSAVAVDLGCRYTLRVDQTGATFLRVAYGWVAFEQPFGSTSRESFVPAGAACVTPPDRGPGAPYFEDAPEVFRTALAKLDTEPDDVAARAVALEAVLGHARPRDALTLWHLLSRTSDVERARVYDRLAALVPPPASVTREGVLRGERHMTDLWWNALGLGDTSWWRTWKGPVPGQ